MKRLLLILAAFSLQATAQTPAEPPKPAASPEKPAATPPAEPRKPLILRLDDVDAPRMSFGRSATETETKKDLPTLGGDARTPDYRMRSNPYPTTSDNLQ